MKSFKNKK